MRRFLLNLHMYLLLPCSGYLIIFGVSSLLFNHPIKDDPEVVTWQSAVQAPRQSDNQKQAQAAADGLGLFGWYIPWDTRRDADGTLHAGFARPGKRYTLHIAPDGNSASVEEKRDGVLGILHFLHGGMYVPGSAFVSSWAWGTRFCSVAVLFAAASGVYLFATRPASPSQRRFGWIVLLAAGTTSIGMMTWMVTLA